jgi:hypothetical protein
MRVGFEIESTSSDAAHPSMTSAKKIEANRRNARKSTGPRTARGKSSARANALRHGLATIALKPPATSARIKLIADAICGQSNSPPVYDQALIIAECEVLLSAVRTARTTVLKCTLERLGVLADFGRNRSAQQMSALSGDGTNDEIVTAVGSGKLKTWQTANSDVDFVRDALSEVARLNRYERRALSRRKRAKRMLDQLLTSKPA